MKREEKEVRETIFNKITVTKEEQAFLTELINAITDLCEESNISWYDFYETEYNVIRKLAETGSFAFED